MNGNKDYYSILGVDKGIPQDDLKKTYKELSKKYHPDKKGGNEEKFKEISEAYDTLKDKSKREMYDRFGKDGVNSNNMNGFNNFNSSKCIINLNKSLQMLTFETWIIL